MSERESERAREGRRREYVVFFCTLAHWHTLTHLHTLAPSAAAAEASAEDAQARVESDRLAMRVLTMMLPSSHHHHGVPGKLKRQHSQHSVMMIDDEEVW